MFYDGACPLCRREIDWYRQLRGASRIAWLDVSRIETDQVAPDLCTVAALERFHVRAPDGQLLSGARAFAELWANLPRLQLAGKLLRRPWLLPVVEQLYRLSLTIRPSLQRIAKRRLARDEHAYPLWLRRDLRSDHAGETGAVAIYRGILAVSRDPAVRNFAQRHLDTERRHLAVMEERVLAAHRSRLCSVWRAAGLLTGAIPALFGARAVYLTIDAVETFVDHHYANQITALQAYPQWRGLRDELQRCRQDEIAHRDEARDALVAASGKVGRVWTAMVSAGSHVGVAIARRV